MATHLDILRRAGTAEEVAQARSVSIHTVRSWVQRGRIPAEHWAGFAAKGWATLDELAEAIATPQPERAA